MTEPALTTALITELARKTGTSWLRYGGRAGRARPAWHLWFEDSLFVVSGGDEQPLPGIEEADRVEVTMRSKDNGGRLVTWVAEATEVRPEDELWEPVTAGLAAARLNVPDLAAAPEVWAATARVTRLRPTGEVVEDPDTLPDDAHLAEPPPSPALTRGRLPRVLHRRVRRRPKLS